MNGAEVSARPALESRQRGNIICRARYEPGVVSLREEHWRIADQRRLGLQLDLVEWASRA
jgi:hypothetical protein